ncbi:MULTISPECIES: BcsR/BcsP family cellulose biosynthesis protein [unclassified Variovorax]|uniref:BcsR/BcsP family cellulose biosynthesis protein n=1 Tax=unclassified Variovorax TaxID=663243 RepID=UPI003F4687A7
MSNPDEPTPEDIAGLFRKFGGDAHGYREFSPPETEGEAPRAWALLSGEKISHPPVQAAAAAAPALAPASAPAPPLAWAPSPLPAPVAAPAPLFAAPQARIEPVLAPLHAPQPLGAPPARPAVAPAAALAAVPAAAMAGAPGAASTPLEQLFERLVSPQPPAAPPGPMSRWRRPT